MRKTALFYNTKREKFKKMLLSKPTASGEDLVRVVELIEEILSDVEKMKKAMDNIPQKDPQAGKALDQRNPNTPSFRHGCSERK
jgi:hypothetical protein